MSDGHHAAAIGTVPDVSAIGPLTTHVFGFTTTASPGQAWCALTSGAHLHGLELVSDWKPGSTVEARAGGSCHLLRGEVLMADAPHRLCLVFDGTYLTWEVTPGAVRLTVDEIDGDSEEEAAAVWGPVMAALEAGLAAAGRIGQEPAAPQT